MAIKFYLEDYHLKRLNRQDGFLNLSHNDHRGHKISYFEGDSNLVYDMSLCIHLDEDDFRPAVQLKGRIVQETIFEILDNVSKKHLEHIVTWANNKLERQKAKSK